VGAFQAAGAPAGKWIGWFFYLVVTAATAYYVNVIGWVAWHGIAQASPLLGVEVGGHWILPPERGFDVRALTLQLCATGLVLVACGWILTRGVRAGIENASRVLTPLLFVGLGVLVVRGLTLPGAMEGFRWLFAFEPSRVTGTVAMAALSQVVFSLALGGTFMVVYGSYLKTGEGLGGNALATVTGDTLAGILAGLAVFPAVFALGLEPASGPGLLFATLPEVFSAIPAGGLVGTIFFTALAGAAFLSAVAALEVLAAGLVDSAGLRRSRAILLISGGVYLAAIPPMLNMRIFLPWDLTFGSGMQTLGALLAALTFGWALDRSRALKELAGSGEAGHSTGITVLYYWIRFVIPGAILGVGAWWVLTDVLGTVTLS
jgi:NSS family neurotransmitter:Na+ symporter